jgi:hypothetical protein
MNIDQTTRGPGPAVRLGRDGSRWVRYDRPGGAAEPEATPVSHPGLIALILKAIRADVSDRRGGVRHEARGREIWVGWWSGDDFGAIRGIVRDIGRGGAKIVLGVRPPCKGCVWIYKDVEDTLACVRGEVAGMTPAPGARFSVRFRFVSPCPTILLQAVICSPSDGPDAA